MAGASGRNDGSANIQTIQCRIGFAQGQSAVIPFDRPLPANAAVVGGGVFVITAFNDATNKLIDVGVVADADGFGTIMSVATIGFVALDELATSDDLFSTSERVCNVTHARTGTAATAGDAIVFINYIVITNSPQNA